MVPPVLAAYHRTAGTPPMPAIVLGAILGVATLGTFAGPGILFHAVGVACIALSVPAVVLLIRLDPRRELRRAASGA
jgi:hypothetical protein